MHSILILRGGGDLASGVALRLQRLGLPVVILELPQPLCVRRTVSFAEAVYAGETTVEGVTARLAPAAQAIPSILQAGEIPVLVDPKASLLLDVRFECAVLVDARLLKTPPPAGYIQSAPLVIGLGPGFTAGLDCHALVETQRGHSMGRVYWQGSSSPDTGQPDGDPQRVLRAPADGLLLTHAHIGEHVEAGQLIAEVQAGQSCMLHAPFPGLLRGLLHPGLSVVQGMKIGDLDPRADPSLCRLVSDKALAVAGGVLEAILSIPELRTHLYSKSS